MDPPDTQGKHIKSTETAFDIIETIATGDRPTVSEIATAVDHSRSTVHYHLETLRRNRYVVRDEGGLRLGLRVARLGELALDQHTLSGVVEGPTDELADTTGAVAHVAVREAAETVWLYRSSTGAVEGLPAHTGTATPIHCTAYGQAILASVPTGDLDGMIESHGLARATEATLTEPDALRDRLSTVRELGFAYSAGEYVPDVSTIAAPIRDESTGEAVGAVGITDREGRFDDPYKHTKARRFSNELPDAVMRAAQIIGDKVADTRAGSTSAGGDRVR